jgi:hypothetical protein
MNARVPKEIREWVEEQAKKDDRNIGYIIAGIVRPLMTSENRPFMQPSNKTADGRPLGAALIPRLDKTAGFDEFWEAYPKKKAKAEALKAWTKNECWKAAGNIITDVSNRVKVDPSWADKQYVPNGATYLNGKRWEDEIIQQDNRPAFQKNNDALRDELFGDDGETYEHE